MDGITDDIGYPESSKPHSFVNYTVCEFLDNYNYQGLLVPV